MGHTPRAALAAAAAALLGAALRPPFLRADERVSVQRSLVSIYLGDGIKDVQTLYPPTREWPTYKEGRLVRVHIERSYAKYFPEDAETIRIGLRARKVVHVQVVFDAEQTRKKPLSELVVDLSMSYGEPRRRRMSYSWQDGATIMRAFEAELPSADGKATELRTCLEIMDPWVYRPSD